MPDDTTVSMNFWCFDRSFFELTEKLFREFLQKDGKNPKSEFFIPIVADHYIKTGRGKIKMITTPSQWFGVTYKEDAPVVKQNLEKLIAEGRYPEKLWV